MSAMVGEKRRDPQGVVWHVVHLYDDGWIGISDGCHGFKLSRSTWLGMPVEHEQDLGWLKRELDANDEFMQRVPKSIGGHGNRMAWFSEVELRAIVRSTPGLVVSEELFNAHIDLAESAQSELERRGL